RCRWARSAATRRPFPGRNSIRGTPAARRVGRQGPGMKGISGRGGAYAAILPRADVGSGQKRDGLGGGNTEAVDTGAAGGRPLHGDGDKPKAECLSPVAIKAPECV